MHLFCPDSLCLSSVRTALELKASTTGMRANDHMTAERRNASHWMSGSPFGSAQGITHTTHVLPTEKQDMF